MFTGLRSFPCGPWQGQTSRGWIFIDDVRIVEPTEVERWEASQRTSSVLFGIQDAARKRQGPNLEALGHGRGPHSSNGQVALFTVKWRCSRSSGGAHVKVDVDKDHGYSEMDG
jgi:hypothetical protein